MRSSRRHILALTGAALAMPCIAPLARAQTYPARPVRLIVPVAAGGANDTTARLFAQKLSESLGQQFYVENVPGAGGNLGTGNAARAPADGYTLLAAGGNFVINPSLYAKIPYDPYKDFAAVSLMCSSPHVLAVHPSVPASTIKEFIALTKASPGKLSYGSAGRGTPAHLAGEMFKLAFGLDIVHVPFTGGGPAITSTLGGHTPAIMSALPTGLPYAKAGNVRARDDEREALIAASGRADHGRGDRDRARGRYRHRPRCAGGNAAGDRRSPPPHRGEDHRAARVQGALACARLRSRCQHARAFCGVDHGGDRQVGQGHSRREHRRAVTWIFALSCIRPTSRI
jgi:Tripartite tricarboxylate transporter family receptor